MDAFFQLAASNLLSPIILFFALGAAASVLKSDLTIPETIGKALSLYLMVAIGFKGGYELGLTGATATVTLAMALALVLSLALPVLAFALLRLLTSLDIRNAAAIAAHYGSVSIVTFVAATGYLQARAIPYEGYVVAMLAVMETPAIVSGLLLARRAGGDGAAGARPPLLSAEVAREVFLSGGVVLLAGSFAIGLATGDRGMAMMGPVVREPFQGVLALFLLDMGLLVGRRVREFGAVGWRVIAFGLYMQPIGAAIGTLAAAALGLTEGGITLVAVLTASASYIVVPAAMRLSLPQANPSIYVTLSLAVTFPFNLLVGIPLYHAGAQVVARLQAFS